MRNINIHPVSNEVVSHNKVYFGFKLQKSTILNFHIAIRIPRIDLLVLIAFRNQVSKRQIDIPLTR